MIKRKKSVITYSQLSNYFRRKGQKELFVFAYIEVDTNGECTTNILADEKNALAFIEEMNTGAYRESFNIAFMEGKEYKKAD